MHIREAGRAALLAAVGLALAGCSTQIQNATPTPVDFKACMVASIAGFNDGGFNQHAYFGLQQSLVQYGSAISAATPKSNTVNAVTVAAKRLVGRGCNVVFANGPKGYSGLLPLADGNKDVHFVALGYQPSGTKQPSGINNNLTSVAWDVRSAYLQAGYLAAAASKTGSVGIIGASGDPLVQTQIWYFRQGIFQYNERSGKSVAIVGADRAEPRYWQLVPSTIASSLLQSQARSMFDSGVDVVLPVGVNGLAVAQVAAEMGRKVIGSDSEWAIEPRYDSVKSAILASVVKNVSDEVNVVVQWWVPGVVDGGSLALAPTASIGEADGENWPDGAAQAMNAMQTDYAAGKLSVIEQPANY